MKLDVMRPVRLVDLDALRPRSGDAVHADGELVEVLVHTRT